MAQFQHTSWLSRRLQNNLGSTDRFVRSFLGAASVMAGWLMNIPEAFWLGMFLIVTATFKFCPNYAIFNFHTLGPDEVKTVIPWEEFLNMLPNRGKNRASIEEASAPTDVDTPPPQGHVSRIEPSNTVAPENLVKPAIPAGEESLLQKKKSVKQIPSLDFVLPPELTHALIKDIEKNALDEMLVVRFYENFFNCKISIQPVAHLNVYICQFEDHTTRLDYTKLKAMLLDRLYQTAV